MTLTLFILTVVKKNHSVQAINTSSHSSLPNSSMPTILVLRFKPLEREELYSIYNYAL